MPIRLVYLKLQFYLAINDRMLKSDAEEVWEQLKCVQKHKSSAMQNNKSKEKQRQWISFIRTIYFNFLCNFLNSPTLSSWPKTFNLYVLEHNISISE